MNKCRYMKMSYICTCTYIAVVTTELPSSPLSDDLVPDDFSGLRQVGKNSQALRCQQHIAHRHLASFRRHLRLISTIESLITWKCNVLPSLLSLYVTKLQNERQSVPQIHHAISR
jgi:hypothetical protein